MKTNDGTSWPGGLFKLQRFNRVSAERPVVSIQLWCFRIVRTVVDSNSKLRYGNQQYPAQVWAYSRAKNSMPVNMFVIIVIKWFPTLMVPLPYNIIFCREMMELGMGLGYLLWFKEIPNGDFDAARRAGSRSALAKVGCPSFFSRIGANSLSQYWDFVLAGPAPKSRIKCVPMPTPHGSFE
jgi:hypothetical protein